MRSMKTPTSSLCRRVLVACMMMFGCLPAFAVDKPIMDAVVLSAPWIVSGAVNDQISASNSPRIFAAAGLPSGVVLNRTTGALSGKPAVAGHFNVRFAAGNAAGWGPSIVVPIDVLPLPDKATGRFVGLVDRYQLLDRDLGGKISFLIARNGTFTGAITLAEKLYRFSGRLDAKAGETPKATTLVQRGRGISPLTMELLIDPVAGTLAGNVTGLEPDGITVAAATFSARRSSYGSSRRVAPELVGIYDHTLTPPAWVIGDDRFPQWTSPGVLIVRYTGVLSWVGRLPDSLPVTATVYLADDNVFPMHLLLYTAKGSAQGWPQLTSSPTGSYLSGELGWFKHPTLPYSSTGWNFQDGFALHNLTVAGEKR